MAYQLDTFLTQVDELTSEDAPQNNGLDLGQRYRCIRLAVQQYSQDRPDLYVEDVAGDDGRYYAIANLTQWVEDFSRVLQIEYPAADVTTDETPQYLEQQEWRDDYWKAVAGTQTRYIYFDSVAPQTGEAFRATYTVPYTWSNGTTAAVAQTGHGFSANDYIWYNGTAYVAATAEIIASHRVTVVTDADNFTAAILQVNTPQNDFLAICYQAACIMCREVAARYSRIGASTLNVDSGAHTGKADNFSRRAAEYCAQYATLLGLKLGDTAQNIPLGVFTDMDTQPAWRCGRRYLFHNAGRCR